MAGGARKQAIQATSESRKRRVSLRKDETSCATSLVTMGTLLRIRPPRGTSLPNGVGDSLGGETERHGSTNK